MTNEEFSNEFDILINRFVTTNSSNPLAFDEYEKSLFLTKSLEELVLGLYTGKTIGDSFEDTELLRRYLADLVKTEKIDFPSGVTSTGLSDRSVFVTLPEDVWFITYESAKVKSELPCMNDKELQVIPITQDEYHRVKGNPFRRPNSRKVLRLDIGDSRIELISKEELSSYLVRYLSRPEPIVLINLPDDLTINGVSSETECKLNPNIHRTILELAVNLAIRSRVQNVNK